jgi:60 kDa SS-A/Ro ribonucleoprotein
MTDYTKHFSVRQTKQTEKIPAQQARMVKNSAGGYGYAVGKWERLNRFLVLGNDGGTYYATERKLTVENAECVAACLREDGPRTVSAIVIISESGRAPKNDPALFALAMAISPAFADENTRSLAAAAVTRVARQAAFLFRFISFAQAMRGWGKLLRTAVGSWYDRRSSRELAYQLTKYKERHGWSHRDVLRLAHPSADGEEEIQLYRYARLGEVPDLSDSSAAEFIRAAESLKREMDPRAASMLIRGYKLPWEAVPTQLLNSPIVWDALLEDMPITAMIRNLGRMTNVGLLAPLSRPLDIVTARLRNQKYLMQGRVHPLSVLVALKTYASGRAVRGRLSWEPVSHVVDALNDAFYAAFNNVPPTGKRILLAVDVSASMNHGQVGGMIGITPRIAAAVMAMVLVRREPNYHITAFSHQMVPIALSPKQRLDDVINVMSRIPMGATDCALPMMYALGHNLAGSVQSSGRGTYYDDRGYQASGRRPMSVDAFVVITDNESWSGKIHPSQALQQYREATGIPAKFIAIGMTATNYSVADPKDALSLNVVGFDTAAPQLISNFISGGLIRD